MHLFLYGNAFWVLGRRGTRGQPRSIRVVPPEDVQFVWLDHETDAVVAYDWRDLQGRIHAREPVENVVHFRDLDATDGLFGFPRLASALLSIAADSEASQYVRQVVTNHGVPGMIVAAEKGTSQDDLSAAELRWREKYATRGLRGMTAFVAGLEGVEQIGFNLQQLEFPDLRRVTREDICAAANVDPRMISVASAASDGGLSGEQYREARFRLIQQTVYPLMRVIETELNHWFMPEFGEALVQFSEDYIAAITEDLSATSARVVAEVAAKIRSVEEARESIGLEAQMDPKHTLPGGMTVAETANAAKAAAIPAGGSESVQHHVGHKDAPLSARSMMALLPLGTRVRVVPGKEHDPAMRGMIGTVALTGGAALGIKFDEMQGIHKWYVADELEVVVDGAARQRQKASLEALKAPKPEPGGDTPNDEKRPALSLARVALPARLRAFTEPEAERWEQEYERAALRLFGMEREELMRFFAALAAGSLLFTDTHVQQVLRQVGVLYAENGRVPRAWGERFEELIARTVRAGGQTLAESAGVDFSLQNPRVRGVVARRTADLVSSVTDTTREAIRAAVVTAREQGFSVQQTAKLIEDTTFGAITKSRAKLIAHQEVLGALNSGEYAAAVQSGVMRSKTWLTMSDDRVRDTHAALDGKTVDIGAAFPNGLRYPHDPLGAAAEVMGCRCTLTFSDLEAGR